MATAWKLVDGLMVPVKLETWSEYLAQQKLENQQTEKLTED